MIEEGGLSPLTLEAENGKYSDRVAIILPLESGSWAIFNAQRKLLGITSSMETLCLLINQAQVTVESTPKRGNTKTVKLSLSDLGL